MKNSPSAGSTTPETSSHRVSMMMSGQMWRWVVVLIAVLGLSGLAGAEERGPTGRVLLVDVRGPIGVATGMQVSAALRQAETEQARLVVLRLDTSGGLVNATRDLIQGILATSIPVAVYVAPSGARAASAGTYIAYAAPIAAMAPGTHLGAATPIQLGGLPGPPRPADPPRRDADGEPKPRNGDATADRKAINDAVAYLRSLAQMRGRNADWAEKAVREAATLTAEEAVRERVVDLIASDINEFLVKIDGRTVVVAGVERKLVTAGQPVTRIAPEWRMRVIAAIADPNIAIILVIVGFYGILFEFWSPGAILPGVTGAISLLLGLIALSVLPVSFGGLALVLVGLALITAEAFVPGFGLLGIGGIAASIIGAVFLIDPAGADIDLRVAWPVIIGVALSGALALSMVLGFAVRARQRRTVTGAEEMIGFEGQVVGWEGSQGTVRAHGEIWSARGPYAHHRARLNQNSTRCSPSAKSSTRISARSSIRRPTPGASRWPMSSRSMST